MTAALVAVLIVLVLIVLVISASVKVLREYERGVVFRLGRLTGGAKGPGLFLLIPIIDRMVRIDLRIVTLQVPPQDIISKDNVPVRVTAVVYFRIVDPRQAVVAIENYLVGTSQIAQTTLRSVLGQHSLDELLAERDRINEILQGIIDQQTEPWGVKVTVVEVKDVELPSGMQRAMARQAEAERERRAKIIGAEGEFQASEKLAQAAEVLSRDPAALQLRYLQTLLEIGGSANASTTLFPFPIDLFKPFADAAQRYADGGNPPPPPPPDAARARSRARVAAVGIRLDPVSGMRVVVAPGRAHRPGAFVKTEPRAVRQTPEQCPFCAGHEDQTPPETLVLPAEGGGWAVRVVPNLFPALEPPDGAQEVVIHSPAHATAFVELSSRRGRAGLRGLGAARAGTRGGGARIPAVLDQRRRRLGSVARSHPLAAHGDRARRDRSSRCVSRDSAPAARSAPSSPHTAARPERSPRSTASGCTRPGRARCRTSCAPRRLLTTTMPCGTGRVSRSPCARSRRSTRRRSAPSPGTRGCTRDRSRAATARSTGTSRRCRA